MKKPKFKLSTFNHMMKFFGFSQAPIRSIIAVLAFGISLGVGLMKNWSESAHGIAIMQIQLA
jgi:hypothetical protein